MRVSTPSTYPHPTLQKGSAQIKLGKPAMLCESDLKCLNGKIRWENPILRAQYGLRWLDGKICLGKYTICCEIMVKW